MLICSEFFHWNQNHVHFVVVTDLLINFESLFPLRSIIASFVGFPDSYLCFFPQLSSDISTLVVSKSLLMMCNSYLVQKTHVSLTMSSFSLICQGGKTCLYKSIMFCSCCLVIAFCILINTKNRYYDL